MSLANYEFQSEFARKHFSRGKAEGKAEGKIEGKAELLLRLIHRKGIPISAHDRQRVLTCTDVAQIHTWADRLLAATTRDELFES